MPHPTLGHLKSCNIKIIESLHLHVLYLYNLNCIDCHTFVIINFAKVITVLGWKIGPTMCVYSNYYALFSSLEC